jgi:raffinose/stachyose/melibiose transport system permease protein
MPAAGGTAPEMASKGIVGRGPQGVLGMPARIGFIIATLFTLALLVFSVYPFIWMVLNTFKTNREIFGNPLSLPQKINLKILSDVWKAGKLGGALRNSMLVTSISVVSIVAMASLAAFALSHLRFRGKTPILAFIVGAQVVSGQVLLIPLFRMFTQTNLIGSILSVILVYVGTGLPLSVYLFWGFFRGMSPSIYESTKIDGCPDRVYYSRILMPLSSAIIGSVIVFQALFCWTEYLFALTFLKDNTTHTIPLQLQVFVSQYLTNWSYLFGALSIAVIPVLVLYVFLQKLFIRGLTAGAIKG